MNSAHPTHQINLSFEGKSSPSIEHLCWKNSGESTSTKSLNYSSLINEVHESTKGDESHRWFFNFPLGISEVQMTALGYEGDWPGFIRWLETFKSARDWRRECRKKIRKEPKRLTDKVQNISLSPTNLRRFKATWAGLKHLVEPLLEIPEVTFLPQELPAWKEKQAIKSKSVIILEGAFDPSSKNHEGIDMNSLDQLIDEHPQVLSEGWIY